MSFKKYTIGIVVSYLAFVASAVYADNKVVVIPLGGEDAKQVTEQCTWVDGGGCSLGAAEGATCTTSVSCSEGSVAISGGCRGFTSVAIGRSSRNGSRSWDCYYQRINTITNSNQLTPSVYCCQDSD